MFVGDDIMYDNLGNAVIPFIAEQNWENQKRAINRILDYHDGKIIVPSHGKILMDINTSKMELNKRLTYLDFFIDNYEASYEDFYESTKINFLSQKWHNYNIDFD